MKIAVVHNVPPGGALRNANEQASRLASRGHQVEAWTLAPTTATAPAGLPLRTAPGADYAPIVDLAALSIAASPLGPLEARRIGRAYAALARAIDAERYDVVFTHGCRYVQQPRLHALLRTPCVIYANEVHRFIHERPRGLGLAKRAALALLSPWHSRLARAERAELAAARAIVAISRATAATLERIHGIVVTTVASPGVDVETFRPLGLARERFVLYPAAIHRRKRQALAIEAVAAVPRERRPRLVLAFPSAVPSHRERLVALARDRQVELELRERIPDEELVSAYNRALAVLYPPEQEPFGLVPLEAMACATPVVAVAEGGMLETIEEGSGGLLVEATAAALGGALDRLIRDDAERAKLGEAGRRRVLERWAWDRAIVAIESALKSAVQT